MNEDVAGGLEETGSFPGDGYDDDRIYLEKNHLLIGCTGGVATTLLPTLLEELSELKYNVCSIILYTLLHLVSSSGQGYTV